MSFADLLGDAPTVSSVAPQTPEPVVHRLKDADVENITAGVTAGWLSKVFRMPRYKIESALATCQPIRRGQGNAKIYDLREAATFLVEPRQAVAQYIHTMKAEALPERLRETYWNAKIKEAKYRVMAGDLWPTEAVLESFGETFKTIKKTTQLWVDTIDESTGLNDEQRQMIVLLVDRLQDDIHSALTEMSKTRSTESFLAELDDGS